MDRDILRPLAGRIAEIAALDIQKKNADMYRALNSLRPVRPVVLIDELPWNQLGASGELELKCGDEYLRSVEREMRRILYKWDHCRCDMIVEPFWRVNIVAKTPEFVGVSVKEETLATDQGNNIISHHYVEQIACIEDLEKFQEPVINVDMELTEKRRDQEITAPAYSAFLFSLIREIRYRVVQLHIQPGHPVLLREVVIRNLLAVSRKLFVAQIVNGDAVLLQEGHIRSLLVDRRLGDIFAGLSYALGKDLLKLGA